MCVCTPLGICIWLFIFLSQGLACFCIPGYSQMGLYLCFPTWVCICLWVFACVCSWSVCEWVDLSMPPCTSPSGFLYEDVVTCVCTPLEICNCNETSDISQMPGKPKVKSDAGEWLGRLSTQIPSGLTTIFFQGEICSNFQAHIDLQGSLSARFYFYFFSFFGHPCGTWKHPGQG